MRHGRPRGGPVTVPLRGPPPAGLVVAPWTPTAAPVHRRPGDTGPHTRCHQTGRDRADVPLPAVPQAPPPRRGPPRFATAPAACQGRCRSRGEVTVGARTR